MSSNIDKSLDEIIKEQKKAKRQQQQKQKKQPQKGKGRGKLATTRQGKATGPARKQVQTAGKRRGNPKQQAAEQNTPRTGVRKQAAGKQVRTGKPRVRANPLRNRQNLQGKLVKKAKKAQVNAVQNRQNNRQAQQKQSRQNQMNKRRGIQINQMPKGNRAQKVQNRIPQGVNKNRNRNRPALKRPSKDLMLTVNISNPRAKSRLGINSNKGAQWQQTQSAPLNQGRRRKWRQSGGRAGDQGGAPNINLAASRQELRISVANNLHQPLPSLPRSTRKETFNIQERFEFNLGKTTSSLNERFSSTSPVAQRVNQGASPRTIFVD